MSAVRSHLDGAPKSAAKKRWLVLLGLVSALALLVVMGRHARGKPNPTDLTSAAASSVALDDSLTRAPEPATGLAVDAGVLGDVEATAEVAASADTGSAVEILADGGVSVDINRASEEDLRKLPGIGATRAKAILALRVRLGRLRGVDDLARIRGFGRKLLNRLRPMIRAS